MTLMTAGLFFAGAVNLLLGLAVFTRDFKKPNNIIFLALTGSVAMWCWGIAAFLHTIDLGTAKFFANSYYVAACSIGSALYVFSLTLIKQRITVRTVISIVSLPVLLAVVLFIFPSAIVHDIYFNQVGDKLADFNITGQIVYSIAFLGFYVTSMVRLLLAITNSHGLKRSQLQYVTAGLVSAGVIGVSFNLILPWFGIYQLVWVGPVFSGLFVAFVGYAIAKHRLFDFKRALARVLAYLLAMSFMVGLYIILALIVSSLIARDTRITFGDQVMFISVAVFSALVFPRSKAFFDRITNSLFYKHAYDTSTFINSLSDILVRTVEIDELLKRSAELIQNTLNADSVRFILLGENPHRPGEARVFSNRKTSRLDPDVKIELLEMFSGIKDQELFVADELQTGGHALLARVMRRESIDMAAPLNAYDRLVGYMLLGAPKGSNNYSEADMRVIEIVADELALGLENALRYEQIEHFNERLKEEIASATRELRRTNEKLKALDEAKDDFISMASHQLRTPLTSVKGYISMVLDGDAGKLNEQQHKLLEQSFISSQRMVYLISDLLNLSRLRTGKFVIEPSPVNLREVISEEVSQLQETAAARGLRIDFDPPKDFPVLQLDDTKTRQVIMNFLDNAIYYTPSGGKINVELSEGNRTVELKVVDTGLGVPKADQHKLFTKFYRANNARRARPDGTGLGLFMAKKVVIAQGGSIIFKSAEGKGSTFGFSLPKKLPAAAKMPAE